MILWIDWLLLGFVLGVVACMIMKWRAGAEARLLVGGKPGIIPTMPTKQTPDNKRETKQLISTLKQGSKCPHQ